MTTVSSSRFETLPMMIDAGYNASRTDILRNKPGGLFAVWDHVVPRQYKKRLFPGRSHTAEHHKFNYLHHAGYDSSWSIDSGLNKTRFHRGFKRRILPRSHIEREEIANSTYANYLAKVHCSIENWRSHPRNLLHGVGLPIEKCQGVRTSFEASSLFESNRLSLDRRRITESEAHFHIPHFKRSYSAPKCESVISGNGTRSSNRTESVGILDNFTHTQAPLKLSPMKPTRRNLSQIVLY